MQFHKKLIQVYIFIKKYLKNIRNKIPYGYIDTLLSNLKNILKPRFTKLHKFLGEYIEKTFIFIKSSKIKFNLSKYLQITKNRLIILYKLSIRYSSRLISHVNSLELSQVLSNYLKISKKNITILYKYSKKYFLEFINFINSLEISLTVSRYLQMTKRKILIQSEKYKIKAKLNSFKRQFLSYTYKIHDKALDYKPYRYLHDISIPRKYKVIGLIILVFIPISSLSALIINIGGGISVAEVLEGNQVLYYEATTTNTVDTSSDFSNGRISRSINSDNITTFSDSTSNNHDLDCTDCPEYSVPGASGNAVDFDGGDITLEDSDADLYLNGLDEISISGWIKSRETNSDQGFLNGIDPNGNDTPLSIRYDQSGILGGCSNCMKSGLEVSNGSNTIQVFIESSDNVQTTSWQHIVMTWQAGGDINLFIDGNLDTPSASTTTNTSGYTISNVQTLLIGKGAKESAAESWDGLIDEVKIWDTALSESEIDELYNNGEIITNPVNLSHYAFEEDNTIDDLKINTTASDDFLSINHYGNNAPDTNNITWWDDDNDDTTRYNWRYRKCYEIQNSSTNVINEYPVSIEIDTENLINQNKMISDGSDIRFVDENSDQLDHYTQSSSINTDRSIIWVKADNIAASSSYYFCMYYGYVPYLNNSVPANVPANLSSKDAVFTYTNQEELYIALNENVVGSESYLSSYVSNNDISLEAQSPTLSQYETYTYSDATSASITQDYKLNTSKAISSANSDETTEGLVPLSLAGEEFVYPITRGDNTFSFYAEWCNANIEVRNQNNNIVIGGNLTVTAGTAVNLTTSNLNFFGIGNGGTVIVESTNGCPIVATHSASNNQDAHIMIPASEEWYGVGSGSYEIAAIQDNTSIDIYDSSGNLQTVTLDRADNFAASGGGSEGTSNSHRIVADKPIGVRSNADSDGTESSTFLPASELGTKFIIPQDTQYATVATLEGRPTTVDYHTDVDVCGDGTPDGGTQTVNPSADYPGKVYFGTTADNNNISEASCIIATEPIFVYFETFPGSEERNLFSYKQNRQKVHPEPTSATSAQQTGSYTFGTADTWQYRIPIDITNNYSSPIDEYPIKIELDSLTNLFNNSQTDGGDIRMAGVNGDGTDNIDFWLEDYDSTNNEGILWLKTDQINSSATDTYYIYYGASSGTQSLFGNEVDLFSYTQPLAEYVVVDDDWANGDIHIYSLEDGNQIEDNNASLTININQRTDLPLTTSTLDEESIISSTGPLSIAFENDGTDTAAPLAFAGNQFVYQVTRYDDIFTIHAPYTTANVEIKQSSSSGYTTLSSVSVPNGQTITVNQDIQNNRAFLIESDQPVVIASYKNSNRDSSVLYPTEQAFEKYSGNYELYGIGSTNLLVAAAEDNTTVDIYRSDGTNSTVTLGNSNNYVYSESGGGSQGSGVAYRLVADKPIGASSLADADGTETMVFYPRKEFSDVYVLPEDTQYMSIVAMEPSVTCNVFDDLGNLVSTGTESSPPPQTGGTLNFPYPNKIYIGGSNTSDGAFYSSSFRLECDSEVFMYYEAIRAPGISDEKNILSHTQARKFNPEVTFDPAFNIDEEGLYFPSGSFGSPTGFYEYNFSVIGQTFDEDVFWRSVEINTNNGTPNTDINGVTDPIQLEISSGDNTTDCNNATFNNNINSTSTTIIPSGDFHDRKCIRVIVYFETGDEAYSPTLSTIDINYKLPQILADNLSNPTIQLDPNFTAPDLNQRILKVSTNNTDLNGSSVGLIYNDISNVAPFTNLELEIEDQDKIAYPQFSLPPSPVNGFESTNFVDFSSDDPFVINLIHTRSTGSLENIEISYSILIGSNNTTRLSRELNLTIPGN